VGFIGQLAAGVKTLRAKMSRFDGTIDLAAQIAYEIAPSAVRQSRRPRELLARQPG